MRMLKFALTRSWRDGEYTAIKYSYFYNKKDFGRTHRFYFVCNASLKTFSTCKESCDSSKTF